jgi:DNA-binding beta-propeller fold protein YncE/4-amino-4-deoxy-L-arabinose transferase-like glycosyltransferase
MRARAIAVSLGLLAAFVFAWRAQWAFQFATPRASGGWQLLGGVAVLFVLWRLAERGNPDVRPAGVAASRAHEYVLAGAFCLLGVAFRTIHFSTVPAGMNHDAAFNGMFALHVLEGAPYTPYISAAWGRETLFMYLCAPLVAWLGNVPEAMQIAATLIGVATLPLFYLFARALCGPAAALVGLALLAVSGWHGVFSRVGWRMIMVPPFELIALFGLWRALESGARRYWLLTGAGAALAIYTYDAGRLVPLMVALLLIVFLLIDRDRRRVRLRGGMVVLAVFVIVGAPMLWYAATRFEQFNARAAHLAVDEPQSGGPLARVATTAAMFNYRGNGNDFFIDEPLLEPLTGVLFVFGVLVVLSRLSVVRGWGVGGSDQPPTPNPQPPNPQPLGRKPLVFLLIAMAVALLPGLLSVPNGNRCIAALPFVYVIIAIGSLALVDAVTLPLPAGTQRAAVLLLLGGLIAVAGIETYREYLGAPRRRILGFGPAATAAGEYLRRFGEDYTRYVIAEDWPEYTLAYLSYNGGGTPLENHYVLGRRLEDIEARINRFGRKGLVFLTDTKRAGRRALERLEPMFAEHRIEAVPAPRLGGAQVATALIVEPQRAARAGAWSNTSRALALGGDATGGAVRCFEPVGDATGVSIRLQLMRPQLGDAPAGDVRFLRECPPQAGAPPLAIGFAGPGLEVRADHAETAVAAAALQAGRWYEIDIAVRADGAVDASVDGTPLSASRSLVAAGSQPLRIAGIELLAPAGGQLFVDDLTVVPGLAPPGDARWAAARRGELSDAFDEDFEAVPYGSLAAGAVWSRVEGAVSALGSPSGAAPEAASPDDAGNAFDGGRGSAPGQFSEPVGVAVDAAGSIYVADRGNHRIQQFSRDGSFVRAWGQQGSRAGEFKEPHDVAVDEEFVYVADTWNQRIQVFDHSGAHVFTITGAPSLSSPRGVFARDRRVYVAEAGGGQVSVYDRSAALQQTFGAKDADAPGHLIEPVDVAVAPDGDVWVVNSGHNRLERFAADGTPLGSIPVPGWNGPQLKEMYLAIDAEGTLYLSDWEGGTVRRFRPDGTELEPLGGGIRRPSGVAIDRDRVLVVSRGDDVVRVLPIE